MQASVQSELPVIDVSCLWNGGSDKALIELGEQIYAACRSVGFFYIANHGVDPSLIAGAFEAESAFSCASRGREAQDQAQPLAPRLPGLRRLHAGLLGAVRARQASQSARVVLPAPRSRSGRSGLQVDPLRSQPMAGRSGVPGYGAALRCGDARRGHAPVARLLDRHRRGA